MVGSANSRLLCMYHNCKRAKTTKPSTRSHASHLQNWFRPPIVSRSSSTPLFANRRHIPLRIPEADAYETASSSRIRACSGLVNKDGVEGRDGLIGFRSIRGVRSSARLEGGKTEIVPFIGVRHSGESCCSRILCRNENSKRCVCKNRQWSADRLSCFIRTVTRHKNMAVTNREKYTTNDVRPNKRRRSSRVWVGSGTMPKKAMSRAPPAMNMVPMAIHGENTSPRRIRANSAFQRRETAPKGARMTTGKDAIWKTEPRTFDVTKIAVMVSMRICFEDLGVSTY